MRARPATTDGFGDASRSAQASINGGSTGRYDDGAIYVQEDPTTDGFGDASGREASIWRLDPDTARFARSGAGRRKERIAEVDRAAALSGGTEDTKVDKFGAWETSGVLDVTDLFDTAQGETLLLGPLGNPQRCSTPRSARPCYSERCRRMG